MADPASQSHDAFVRPVPFARARIDARLAMPAAACWLVAALLIGFPGGAASAAIAFGIAAAVTASLLAVLARGSRRELPRPARRHRRSGTRLVPGLAMIAVLGVSLAGATLVASVVAVREPGRMPAVVAHAIETHDSPTVEIVLQSAPVVSDTMGGGQFGAGGVQLRARGTIVSLTGNGGHSAGGDGHSVQAVAVPAVMFFEAGEPPFRYEIGATLSLTGTMKATTPGDAAAVLFFGTNPPEARAPPAWWLAWANGLRSGFSAAAATLGGDGAALLPGLSIGDTSAVTDDLDDAMKQSSLSHLTAVSGANCALVIAIIMVCGGYLRLRRGLRIALSLLVLVGFVVLVTPEASVLRAAVMASIVMLSLGAGRPGRGVPALLLAVIILLISDPWLSRNYGFALSVLATAGLLVLAAPLAQALGRWMPQGLAALLALPLAAQLACQPVLVLLSPTLALYGVPANLLAAPAAPMATMLGLLACLLLPFLPGVANAVLQVAWWPSSWIAATARFTAELPGSRLPWVGGAVGVVSLVVLTALVLVLLLARTGGVGRRATQMARVVGFCALAAFVAGYAGTGIGSLIGRATSFPADWQIAACDIGQGDAVLVRDGSQIALVDVGPDPALLDDCLAELGISHIDLLVLTHYDQDHVGGLDAVLGIVDTALVGEPASATDERVQARLRASAADVREAAKGDAGQLGEVWWEVLWPLADSSFETGNDGSVVVTFEGRGIRSIFLGDLGEAAQDALWTASHPAPVDVVKVAHHGSGDQSALLYERLRARVGVISVGLDNGYGHPTPRLLDLLETTGATEFRTDEQGMVVIAPDSDPDEAGGALTIWTERSADNSSSR